jgi:predicted nuclease with TOPRIM domain
MDVDESTRRLVHDRAAGSGGPELAAALMAMLPTGPATDLATRSDLERLGTELRGDMGKLSAELRGEMAGVKGEIAELRGEMRGEIALVKGEIAELRGEFAELRGEFAELRGEFSGLRGEFAEVRGEMKAVVPRLYFANALSMIGVAGLVLAAVNLS